MRTIRDAYLNPNPMSTSASPKSNGISLSSFQQLLTALRYLLRSHIHEYTVYMPEPSQNKFECAHDDQGIICETRKDE
jgi:hypothetical protein